MIHLKATIIGTNKLASSLAMAFEKADIKVGEVFSYDIREALSLADRLYAAVAVNSLNFSRSDSNLFIICKDGTELVKIIQEIILPPDSLLVHTSPTLPLSILESLNSASKTGVISPLYSLKNKEITDFKDIPVLVESTNETLIDVSKKLSKRVQKVSHHQRMVYSSAIAFAINFSNHLWALSKEVLESEELDFDFIKPLIIRTAEDILDAEHPANCQTGPAVNNDAETINAHMALLSDDEDLLKVYTVLTESILDWHGED